MGIHVGGSLRFGPKPGESRGRCSFHHDFPFDWDLHRKIYEKDGHYKLCRELDTALAGLLGDLESSKTEDGRSLLEKTFVCCMGEFGRTPGDLTVNEGRDHHKEAFCGIFAGCGTQGGRVIGATDEVGAGRGRGGGGRSGRGDAADRRAAAGGGDRGARGGVMRRRERVEPEALALVVGAAGAVWRWRLELAPGRGAGGRAACCSRALVGRRRGRRVLVVAGRRGVLAVPAARGVAAAGAAGGAGAAGVVAGVDGLRAAARARRAGDGDPGGRAGAGAGVARVVAGARRGSARRSWRCACRCARSASRATRTTRRPGR